MHNCSGMIRLPGLGVEELFKIAVNGRGQSSAHHTVSRNKVA